MSEPTAVWQTWVPIAQSHWMQHDLQSGCSVVSWRRRTQYVSPRYCLAIPTVLVDQKETNHNKKTNHIMNSCEMSVIPAQCCAQPNVHSTQQAAANALLFWDLLTRQSATVTCHVAIHWSALKFFAWNAQVHHYGEQGIFQPKHIPSGIRSWWFMVVPDIFWYLLMLHVSTCPLKLGLSAIQVPVWTSTSKFLGPEPAVWAYAATTEATTQISCLSLWTPAPEEEHPWLQPAGTRVANFPRNSWGHSAGVQDHLPFRWSDRFDDSLRAASTT